MVFYKYSTIQCTDTGVFLFMDNQIEMPTMGKCSWLRQFDSDGRTEAFAFAIRWTLVKVSELQIFGNGKRSTKLLYIRDPKDKTRPYQPSLW